MSLSKDEAAADAEREQFFALNKEKMLREGWTPDEHGWLVAPPGTDHYEIVPFGSCGRHPFDRTVDAKKAVAEGWQLISTRGESPFLVFRKETPLT